MINNVLNHEAPRCVQALRWEQGLAIIGLETGAGDPNPGRAVQLVEELGQGLHLQPTGEHLSGLTRWGTDVGVPEDVC